MLPDGDVAETLVGFPYHRRIVFAFAMRLLEQAHGLVEIAAADCDARGIEHVVEEGVHVGRSLQADRFLIEGWRRFANRASSL